MQAAWKFTKPAPLASHAISADCVRESKLKFGSRDKDLGDIAFCSTQAAQKSNQPAPSLWILVGFRNCRLASFKSFLVGTLPLALPCGICRLARCKTFSAGDTAFGALPNLRQSPAMPSLWICWVLIGLKTFSSGDTAFGATQAAWKSPKLLQPCHVYRFARTHSIFAVKPSESVLL